MTRQETTDWLYGTIATHGGGDLISDCIRDYGEWARVEVEFICRYLLPHHGTFVDVGAFIGTHTIPFALHVGISGKGISFEPNRSSFSLLSANLRTAGLENVTAYNTAASESSGIPFSLFSEPGNNGQTTLYADILSENPSVRDSMQCIGQAIDDLHLGHVDLIKADVEGMERSVLSGCIKLIEDCKPNIFLELNSLDEHGFVFEFAKKFDYAVYGVRTLAFNNANYKKNPINDTLDDGAELGIVFTNQDLPNIGNGPEDALNVKKLNDLEDLRLFLLSKPQYRARLQKGFLPEQLARQDYQSAILTSAERWALTERSRQLIKELGQAHENTTLLKEQLNVALESEQQTREQLNAIKASKSWAITEPYRKLASLIRGSLP